MKTLYITYMSLTEPLSHSQVLPYLKGLAEKDISVSVLSFEKDRFATEANIRRIRQDLSGKGIKWFFLRYHKTPQSLAKVWDITCGLIFSFFIAFREGIDVIHARNTISAFMAALPVLCLRRKMIFDIRGFMAEEYVDADLWRRGSFVYRFVGWLERYFAGIADENIVITRKAMGFLAQSYGVRNSVLIPTCVDLKRFRMGGKQAGIKPGPSEKERFVFIYTGSVGTWYMLSEMIDFFKALLSRLGGEAVFLILSQTEKDVIEKGIPPAIAGGIVLRTAEPGDVPDFLASADAGIFFIKPCLSKMSSCPTKFAEYLACGLPVVINRGIGDTEEIVEENRVGVVVRDFTEEEYASAIEALMRLMKEGAALSRRCRETAIKYFSLDKGIDKYLDVYSGLMR